jgi:hypothetical protein
VDSLIELHPCNISCILDNSEKLKINLRDAKVVWKEVQVLASHVNDVAHVTENMEQRGRHGLTRIFSTRPLQPPPPLALALAPLRFRAPALLSIVCAVHLTCHQSPAAATTSYSSHSRQPAPPRWSSASASTRTSLPPPRSLCLPHRSRCFPAFGQVGISYSSIAASARAARIPAAPCGYLASAPHVLFTAVV